MTEEQRARLAEIRSAMRDASARASIEDSIKHVDGAAFDGYVADVEAPLSCRTAWDLVHNIEDPDVIMSTYDSCIEYRTGFEQALSFLDPSDTYFLSFAPLHWLPWARIIVKREDWLYDLWRAMQSPHFIVMQPDGRKLVFAQDADDDYRLYFRRTTSY